jgi:hypothetical protein
LFRKVCVDLSGSFYIIDQYHFLIRKVDGVTNIITTFVGNAATRTSGFSGDNGPATSAVIGIACGLTLDVQQNNLYFSDAGNNRIRKVDLLKNIITTFAGTGNTNFNDNIYATSANLYYPVSVRFDTVGNLYFSDYSNKRIRKIDSTTAIVSTIGGNGVSGYGGDNIKATSTSIGTSDFVTIDVFGHVYFTEVSNSRVRKINSNDGF